MNVGIICNNIKIIDKLKSFPNNTYIVFYTSLHYEKLYEIIDFLFSRTLILPLFPFTSIY